MPHRSRAHVATVASSIALFVLCGCADDGDNNRADVTESEPAARDEPTTDVPATTEPRTDDEVVVFTLCSALRDQANVMTGIANAAAADIHEKSPEERYDALYSGFDQGAEASVAFRDSLVELELPAIPELDDLLGQISAGADAAAAEFVDEQGLFAEAVGGAVADGDVRGRVGELFNSIEKANSLVEPVIVRYERVELKRAFLDEPECRYVIQQFVLEEA